MSWTLIVYWFIAGERELLDIQQIKGNGFDCARVGDLALEFTTADGYICHTKQGPRYFIGGKVDPSEDE